MKQWIRRGISLLLVLAILSTLGVGSLAAPPSSGTCGAQTTWEYDGSWARLIFGGVGPMEDVEWNGTDTRTYREHPAQSAVFLPGITHIGAGALYDMDAIYGAEIPDTVKTIGAYAFADCKNMGGFPLSEKLQEMGEGVFANSGIGSIELPESLTKIPAKAFANSGLQTITIPASIQEIGTDAFAGCTLQTVHYAGTQAQWDAIQIGAGNEALAAADAFYTVEPPAADAVLTGPCGDQGDNVTWTYDYATRALTFTGTGAIRDFQTVDPEERAYAPYRLQVETAIFGEGITRIGQKTLDSFNNVEQVELPGTLTSIGVHAFAWCRSLEQVNIPNSVTEMGFGAFLDSGLTSLTLPRNLTKEEGSAAMCQSLKTVTIPAGVQELSIMAFTMCPLTDVYFGGTRAQWDSFGNVGLGYQTVVHCADDNPHDAFTDLPNPTNWAYPGIAFCLDNGLLNGMSDTTFLPKDNTNRAMLVTILWRYAGEPIQGSNSFTDVEPNRWYTKAINWASDTKVVEGMGNGLFGTERDVTRQQLATILYRYATNAGIDTADRADLSGYADAAQVSSWAQEAMEWAVAVKLVQGVKGADGIRLDPDGTASREQVATILQRFCQTVAAIPQG